MRPAGTKVSMERAETGTALRLSQLSTPRQALVRLFQSVNYGEVQGIRVQDGEPFFNPARAVLVSVRLDQDDTPRPEINLPDFNLSAEHQRLMKEFDRVRNGIIASVEVRAGIPRRVVYEFWGGGVRVLAGT